MTVPIFTTPAAPGARCDVGVRPAEIEPFSNRFLIHRISDALLGPAIATRVHPNTVTLAGLLFGIAAAACYSQWHRPAIAVAGLLLMLGWHICDGLDGSLARATGKSSALGRLLDGVADYSTFVAVYLVLAFSQEKPLQMLALAAAAGLAHALQSAFYEAQRATYLRRSRGIFTAAPRTEVGGLFERTYNRVEQVLGNRTRPFDWHVASLEEPARSAIALRWRMEAVPYLKVLTFLSANTRTGAIFLAAIAGAPWAFWLFELIVLTALALVVGRKLHAIEAGLMRD